MASPAFERFRFSFFEDPYSARDELDTAAPARRAGGKRDILAAIAGRPISGS